MAQNVFYARNVKITVPTGWIEKQSWELDVSEFIPLYNRQFEGVAFVRSLDQAEPGLIKDLAEGDEFTYLLDFLLSNWPAEASRFRLMVSGGFSVSKQDGNVWVGPGVKAGRTHYLGKIKTGSGELELVDWVSEAPLDQKSAKSLVLPPEFANTRAQILFGRGVLASTGADYGIIAARFASPAEGLAWIQTVLAGLAAVPDSEKNAAASQNRLRTIIQGALADALKEDYSKALEKVQEALALAPDDANALNVKGGILVRQKKNDEAVPILRKAIAINPDHEQAHFNLAAALWNVSQKEEALKEFETVRRLSPLYPGIDEMLRKLKSIQ